MFTQWTVSGLIRAIQHDSPGITLGHTASTTTTSLQHHPDRYIDTLNQSKGVNSLCTTQPITVQLCAHHSPDVNIIILNIFYHRHNLNPYKIRILSAHKSAPLIRTRTDDIHFHGHHKLWRMNVLAAVFPFYAKFSTISYDILWLFDLEYKSDELRGRFHPQLTNT